MVRGRVLLLLLLATLVAHDGRALETDQYATWGIPLEDGTAALNAKINFEILRAIDQAEARDPGGTPSCARITREFRRRVDFAILQPIEAWVTHSSLVPRLPATPEEELTHRRTNIYGDFGPLDIGRWVPDSPTVQVNGVRFGTDKISHFFSNGWRYHGKYVSARRRGLSDEEAQDAAIRWGVLEERTGTGLLVDGVFSRGDLEANLAGMNFYLCLCEGPDPLLEVDDGRWTVRRLFDWRDYVTPSWDESYHVSIYAPYRWRKVRPRLLDYCGRRDEAAVVEMMERYEEIRRTSPNDKVIEALVEAGTLRDPSSFTLDAICPPQTIDGPEQSHDERPPPTPLVAGPEPGEEKEIMTEIAAREAGRERRIYLLPSFTLTSSHGPSASIGWLFTRVEKDFDCHTICDLRGPTLQVEPGLDGGQVTFGYARIFGETGHRERFLFKPYLALGVRGTILQTWGEGELGPSGLTFAGLQGQLTITKVNFRIGASWHVAGERPTHDQVLTWAFGWGF